MDGAEKQHYKHLLIYFDLYNITAKTKSVKNDDVFVILKIIFNFLTFSKY